MSVFTGTVFAQGVFYALVICSLLLPAAIYRSMWMRRAISRPTVLAFGISLVVLAGVDVYLLRAITSLAILSPSTFDDAVFDSQLTVALYLLPTVFAGTGLNIISHVLIGHLAEAEQRFRPATAPPSTMP